MAERERNRAVDQDPTAKTSDDDPIVPEETAGKPGGDRMTSGGKRGSMTLALAIGTAGGLLFAWAQLPLPWMMGAMVATTIASVAGANIRIEYRLRMSMIAILGVMLGSAFSPDLIDRAGEWAVSIAGLLVYAVTAGALVTWYFRKVGGYDPVTSYFASSPGGLNEMVLVGRAMGGDDRVIALTHSARILLVVMTIPFVFRIFADYTPSGTLLPPGAGLDLAPVDWALLAGCAVVGAIVGKLLRIPAAFLVGPMAVSGVIHLAGFTEASPPSLLVACAQVVMGSGIGCRFAGTPVREIARIVKISIGSTAILMVSGVLFGLALESLTGVPWFILVLAYAPGGLAEMSLIALALGRDVAFVATHHIFRIGFIVILAPAAFRLMRRGAKD
ncbi:MAG: AbrB family transcriptional regulator [Alphaproteobacteria bacterium]|nr:AbrB family transcriptional regulator [Alphaproteobacteria bacterium]